MSNEKYTKSEGKIIIQAMMWLTRQLALEHTDLLSIQASVERQFNAPTINREYETSLSLRLQRLSGRLQNYLQLADRTFGDVDDVEHQAAKTAVNERLKAIEETLRIVLMRLQELNPVETVTD